MATVFVTTPTCTASRARRAQHRGAGPQPQLCLPSGRTSAGAASALALAVALGVGAVAGLGARLGQPGSRRPTSAQIKSVPLIRQRGQWCGPAALASVLRFHGEQVTQEQIARDIYLPRSRGTLNLDLLLYARRHGYAAQAGEGDLEGLRRAIASGTPVICQLRQRTLLSRRDHFVVVFGYDDAARALCLHSGSQARVRSGYADFDRSWAQAGRWMLVVTPAARAAPGAVAEVPRGPG